MFKIRFQLVVEAVNVGRYVKHYPRMRRKKEETLREFVVRAKKKYNDAIVDIDEYCWEKENITDLIN